MRVFVAVFPPPRVRRAALDTAREGARDLGDRIRWTSPDKVHVTLKFLGEVGEGPLEGPRDALRGLCANHAPFDASLAGFGAFPSVRRARVVWAGTGGGSEELCDLAADVESAFEALGFEQERRAFVPHATLGRVRGLPVSLELPKVIPGEPRFQVARVELVESRLGPQGSVYKVLDSQALRSD